MTISQMPTPTLQPIAEEKTLLTIAGNAGSCCGGSSCAID